MMSFALFPAILASIVALQTLPPGDDPAEDKPLRGDVATGLDLLKQADKLADESKFTDAEVRYHEAMEKLLPGLRRLEFKHPVKHDVTPREELRQVVLKMIEEDMTPQEFRAKELMLKAFGLIPRGLDYKETMINVHTQEIGAFYDPKTKTMHLIKEQGAGRQPGLLESLMGRKPGFSKDETKITVAHELAHALADQHYDLDSIFERVKKNDDANLAFTALVEGEATLVMMGASLEDWTGAVTSELPADNLGRTFNFMMPFLGFMSGPALRAAPPIMSESMLYPYLRGLVFCARLTNDGGWTAIDAAYANPPSSTEQVLHPEKYKAQPDPPTLIDLGKLDAGPEWTELQRNVLGELQTSVLLRSQKGKEAAAGWDGDQYAVFEGPDDRLALVWLTTWDSEDDALEFARAMARYQHARFGGEAPPRRVDRSQRERDGAVYLVERRGNDVAVVEGFAPASSARLLDATRSASKKEVAPEKPGQ